MEENIPDVLSDQIDDPNLPDGGSIGSLDCANVDYDDPHLYRPHAFALRHGDDGAQIAYGELHWRVDTFTLQFKESTASGVSVTVDDHPDHTHEPHSSHTHTAGVASHDHDHSHTHEHDHTHTAGVASHDHEHVHTHTAGVAGHTHPITDDIHQGHTGAGTGSSDALFGSGSYSSSDNDEYTHDHGGATQSNDTAASGTINTGNPNDATTGNVNSGSGTVTTSSPDDSTTGVPNNITTGNVNSGSGTVVTSGPTPALTHSGVKDVSDGTSSAPTGVLQHNVTVSGGLNSIIYCSGAGQSAINNITQQVPKINEKDGEAMDSKLDGVHTFHQLDGYGEVYLCWEVDFEESPNVQKCWVQIGVPVGSVTGAVSIGNTTTGRLAQPPDPDYAVSTYHVHIGTVNLNERVVQKISSDVSWQPIVMDRVRV